MKWNLRKSLMFIMAILMMVTTFSHAATANSGDTAGGSYEIVAIGDSITVGYEQNMSANAIPYGYVDRLYEQALFHGQATLANYGIMGLTTSGLSQLLIGASEGKKMRAEELQDFSAYKPGVLEQAETVAIKGPEIATKLKSADLIVITVGGNDFSPLIKKLLLGELTKDTLANDFNIELNNYTTELIKAIQQLHTMAPQAQIVIADQYLPLWHLHALYPDLILLVDKLANQLDSVAEQLTKEGIPLKVAHLSSFKGNESIYTYVTSFEYDNHPKQIGYEAIAEEFAKVIWNQYQKPAPRAADVPLSVIVNGQLLLSKPILKNDNTFIALTDVAKAVNADVEWINTTKTAVFRKNGLEVSLTIGASKLYVNGTAKNIRTPAYLAQVNNQSKTYVPLAAIADGLGYQVVYRDKLKTAFINS